MSNCFFAKLGTKGYHFNTVITRLPKTEHLQLDMLFMFGIQIVQYSDSQPYAPKKSYLVWYQTDNHARSDYWTIQLPDLLNTGPFEYRNTELV